MDPADKPTEPAEAENSRKEKVLHTRVPALLERELKNLADSMRVPVSNVVRVILEDALKVADRAGGRVEEQLRQVADRVTRERELIRDAVTRLDPLKRMLAFQPVVLAHPATCPKCGKVLAIGEDAFLGIASEPGPPVFVCDSCVPNRGAKTPQ